MFQYAEIFNTVFLELAVPDFEFQSPSGFEKKPESPARKPDVGLWAKPEKPESPTGFEIQSPEQL